jgi:hypothetical protein
MKEIAKKYEALKGHLDEKARRLWCATEAIQLGRGGITIVLRATGITAPTIRRGIREVEHPETIEKGRIRKIGGGRKRLEGKDIDDEIERLVEPVTRGDPESPLRWTSKSTRKLADELNKDEYKASYKTIGRRLQDMDYTSE